MRIRALCVAVLLAIPLTACSDKPEVDQARPGQCVADERTDAGAVAPDFTTVVRCTDAHIFEVLDVIDVPEAQLRADKNATTGSDRAGLARLLASDEDSDIARYAGRECRRASVATAGLAKVRIGHKSAARAGVHVVLAGGALTATLSTDEEWKAGHRQLICTMRYTSGRDDSPAASSRPVRSPDAQPLLRRYANGSFPAYRRQCALDDQYNFLETGPCMELHYGEVLFAFDASSIIEARHLDYPGSDEVTERQIDQLGSDCVDAFSTMLGPDFSDQIAGTADTGTSGWEDDDPFFETYCVAVPDPDDVLFRPGSIVGHPTLPLFEKLDADDVA